MFTVFDLEATGTGTTVDDIIQFSYATFDDNNLLLKAETLYFFYPELKWSKEAEAIHGIPYEYLTKYEKDFEKNLVRMWTVLSGANVIGFNNIHFDCPFASNWLSRFGFPKLKYGVIQDVMLAFRPMTKRPRIKLVKLCEMCKIEPSAIKQMASIWFPNEETELRAHNASYDVAATAMLTMLGLRKQYISFDINVVLSQDLSSIDTSLLSSDDSKVELPYAEHVKFNIVSSDGTTMSHQFVSDVDKYGDRSSMAEQDSLLFPVDLHEVDTGVYEGSDSNAVFRLLCNKLGDMFTVKTEFGEVSTPQMNLRTFTENYLLRR